MAKILNKIAGYQGYTISGPGDTDVKGYVDYVQFGIDYDTLVSNVDIEVSTDANAFGAMMGDGTIILLSDPTVIAHTIGCAVIQFKMESTYPSNSPCILVYHTDQAYINITERS